MTEFKNVGFATWGHLDFAYIYGDTQDSNIENHKFTRQMSEKDQKYTILTRFKKKVTST